MKIYQQGGENPTFRRILLEHASSIAVSWWGIRARVPKIKPYDLRTRLNDKPFILTGSGTPQDKDPDALDMTTGAYHKLVENNLGEMDFAVEIDAYREYDRVLDWREEFWDHLPAGKFCPVWVPGLGLDELRRLCVTYHRVAVYAQGLQDARAAAFLRGVREVKLHGLGIADTELLRAFPLVSASSSGWTNPMRHGEIIYWDGKSIGRHAKEDHEEGIRRARQFASKVGMTPEQVDARDGVSALAVRAYSALEEALTPERPEQVATTSPRKDPQEDHQVVEGELVIGPDVALNYAPPERMPSRRPEPRTRSLLPILTVEQDEVPDESGDGTKIIQRVVPSGRQLLACDNCALASKCPEFTPGAECAYEIPVTLRSKDDLTRFLSALLEIQGQRVIWGRFTELLEGGYPDPNTSSEMDRFFKLLKITKDIEDNREYLKLEVEARASSGVLSRLFGTKIGDQARALPAPIDAQILTEVVEDHSGE